MVTLNRKKLRETTKMYTGDDIKKQRRKIQANVLKSFGEVDLFEGKGTSNNLMSSMNKAEETDLEKAHNQGDVHPNGKWYWESSAAGGKGDWRVIGGKRHKQSTSSAPKKEEKEPAKKEEKKTQIMGKVDTFEDLLKIAPKKYHDYLKRANNEYEKEKKKFVKDFEEEAEESTPKQIERAKKNFEDFTQSVPDYGTDKYYYVGLKEMVRDAESGRYDVDKLLGESHMKEIARKNASAAARRIVLSSNESKKLDYKSTESVKNWLKENKIKYDFMAGQDRDYFHLTDGVKLIINSGVNDQNPGGVQRTSNNFDKEPVYVSVLDSFYYHPKAEKIFNKLREAGLEEATNGKNAQYGTWKFAIRSNKDLEKLADALKNKKSVKK